MDDGAWAVTKTAVKTDRNALMMPVAASAVLNALPLAAATFHVGGDLPSGFSGVAALSRCLAYGQLGGHFDLSEQVVQDLPDDLFVATAAEECVIRARLVSWDVLSARARQPDHALHVRTWACCVETC